LSDSILIYSYTSLVVTSTSHLPISTLFPYTTLFRSLADIGDHVADAILQPGLDRRRPVRGEGGEISPAGVNNVRGRGLQRRHISFRRLKPLIDTVDDIFNVLSEVLTQRRTVRRVA